MFDIFLKHFKDNNVTEFEAKTSDGNVVRFFKLYIDWYTFIIYAAITNGKSENDISGILYHIIGMGDDENKRSVFFLNETSKKLFTQEELTELSSIANTPLLDFDSIKNAIRKAVDGSAPEKYIHKIPDAESIATIRNHFIDKDFVKFSFSKNPEEDIVQDVVDAIDDYSHVLMFDGTITFDLVGVRGKWAKNIAVTFLYSVFQPEFPFYNFSNEKNKYVSRILKHIKKARKNKRSLSYKYHAIPGAVQKYDNVTIDFLDSEKRPRTITVKSAAFKNIRVNYDGYAEDIYMPVTNETTDMNALQILDKAFPDIIIDEAYPRHWLPWGSILCIRYKNRILWHFSETIKKKRKRGTSKRK